MAKHIELLEDDEGPLTEGEYEEGLDDDDYDDEEEDYDEGADVIEELSGEENEQGGQGFIRGLEPLPGTAQPGPQSKRQTGPTTKPWRGLESLPAATREKYVKLLGQLRDNNKQELTILILGKYFTGKSLTVNSLLNEDAASHSFLQRDQASLAVHSREAHGFKLTIIDVAGLNEADAISEAKLKDIVECVRGQAVDVLLYIDRFDLYRPDGLDEQVLRAISRTLGAQVWKNAILGLSYAGESVNGYEWESFSKQRAERLQQVVRRHGQNPSAELPVAFIENSRSCPENSEGEKTLPDKTAWLPVLMQKVADVATSQAAFRFDQKAVDRAANPNRKLRWLVPVIFAVQIAFKVFVFDRLVDDDKLTGDKHGPYDPALVRAYRSRRAQEREFQRKKAQRRSVQRAVTYYDSDSD